jgi:hypothetical protein
MLPCRLEQNLFALQTVKNKATRQAGFVADKAQSDDDDDDDDDGSSIAPEGTGATHDDDVGKELEGKANPSATRVILHVPPH